MLLVSVIAFGVIALAQGVAGDFVATVTGCAGFGSWIAAVVALVVRWRRKRRVGPSPWAVPEPVEAHSYLLAGAAIGGSVGLTIALFDAGVLSPR
jgi:hypothetical protein